MDINLLIRQALEKELQGLAPTIEQMVKKAIDKAKSEGTSIDTYYTMQEAAELIGMSKRWVEEQCKKGLIGHLKFKSSIRIPGREMEKVIQEHYRRAS